MKFNLKVMMHSIGIRIPFEKGYENDYTEPNEESSEKTSNSLQKN